MNGPGTEVQRTYNGTALEGVEISRRISLKSVLSCGDGFEMFFAFLHLFSSILNKVKQPEIYACCYVIETVSYLCSIHNSLIIFILGNCSKQVQSRPVTSNR